VAGRNGGQLTHPVADSLYSCGVDPRLSSNTPRAVGLVVHAGRDDVVPVSIEGAEQLLRLGANVRACSSADWPWPGGVQVCTPDAFVKDLDVIVVYGGDGTFLRAAYLARDHGVPLLGVNLGRLGFLSEVESEAVPQALERLVSGDFEVEERMTLAVEIRDAEDRVVQTSWALNEASMERTEPQRLIVMEVSVGDTVFANVPADALICATPTGSTAYAFSARGPILSPLVDAILLVPVAPHSLFDRTLVIDPQELLSVRPHPGRNRCTVSLDGRESMEVPVGGRVVVARGDAPVLMARMGPPDFYARVRHKFNLQ
jgi:NAD+ kinase